ncbi:polynucleotide adenylyltransferase PcnB [Agaribacter flavus]|uniref:Poly(A) polymerase I n=1 Tax=Agaribacter flavus TaxID=1902781 RepID=A0ABV7FUH9_9ALTE
MSREKHCMRREDLSKYALNVLDRLCEKGYEAYAVGGCVRDRLMGYHPKDFDVVTNATPEQVKSVFKNCRLIGRRFRLAHIHFGREIIEVATYRGHHTEAQDDEDSTDRRALSADSGQILRDNVFGTIEEDAARRDFTFNAMYFNAQTEEILDFAEGIDAINKKEIRMIGDIRTRFAEDPVRMLRAARFSVKLNMLISDNMVALIDEMGGLLANIPPARLFEETNKLLLSTYGAKAFNKLLTLNLIYQLFPCLSASLRDQSSKEYLFIQAMLENTDARLLQNLRVTPAFLYASFLWYPLEELSHKLRFESGMSEYDAINIAGVEVLNRQVQRVMIPKRFTSTIRDIWALQYRLSKRTSKRPFVLLTHTKFRAAYDFLALRGQVEGGATQELAEWWTDFQKADEPKRRKMLGANKHKARRPRKKPSKD